eukprot:1145932-Pelagomonas_calceolata.AAC.3
MGMKLASKFNGTMIKSKLFEVIKDASLHAAAVPPPTFSRPRVLTIFDFDQVHMLLACPVLLRKHTPLLQRSCSYPARWDGPRKVTCAG